MEEKDLLHDKSISTLELLEIGRKQREEKEKILREELSTVDAGINVKCNFIRNNPNMCRLDALQAIMDALNSGAYTFIGKEHTNGEIGVYCSKGSIHEIWVHSSLANISWAVKTHYQLAKDRREQEEIDEFVSKLPITVSLSTQYVATTNEAEEPEESDKHDGLGRDPMRWLFFELRRRGYIKNDDDTVVIKRLCELTGYSYRPLYNNKNAELTGQAKRRLIKFLEDLIEKLNK